MLNSRHWAILAYAGLAGVAIFKDIVSSPQDLIALLAPVAGIFVWDKIASRNQTK